MKKIYVGIDISKEKLNLCYLKDLAVIREEECENDVKGIKKSLKASFKVWKLYLKTYSSARSTRADTSTRLPSPVRNLTYSCGWMTLPASRTLGLTRGKNDAIDAIRIAEYAYRYSDKAVRYAIPDAALVSMKNLLSDREFLPTDKKRFQMQLSDQKKYMAPGDFKHKNSRWNKVLKAINEQIKAIDAEIESIIAANRVLTRQKDLLTSIDGVGDRIAINMIAITGGFTRFQNARQFCSFAGLTPYKYDSGTPVRSKAKISKRANQTMKTLLHMSAVNVATRMKEGEYKEYYERKLKEGKHKMCIFNVLRAKLVYRMFSVIKRDELYTKQYKPAF